jgi:cell division protein FtsL
MASVARELKTKEWKVEKPGLRLVKGGAGRKTSEKSTRGYFFRIFVLTAVYLGLLALAYVALQAQIVENGLRLNSLQNEISRVQDENTRLSLELAELKSPQRIITIARDKLGMVMPGEVRYLVVEEQGKGKVGKVKEKPFVGAVRSFNEQKGLTLGTIGFPSSLTP